MKQQESFTDEGICLPKSCVIPARGAGFTQLFREKCDLQSTMNFILSWKFGTVSYYFSRLRSNKRTAYTAAASPSSSQGQQEGQGKVKFNFHAQTPMELSLVKGICRFSKSAFYRAAQKGLFCRLRESATSPATEARFTQPRTHPFDQPCSCLSI